MCIQKSSEEPSGIHYKNPAKPVRETQRNRRTHRLGSGLGGFKDSQVFTGFHRTSQNFTELHRSSKDIQKYCKPSDSHSKPSEEHNQNSAKRTLTTQRGTHRPRWHEVVESMETFQRNGNFPAEQVHMVVSSESARFFQRSMVRVSCT